MQVKSTKTINLSKKLPTFFNKYWPFLLIFTFVFIFFWKVFLKGLVPIPADFIVGTYFPWLDYKWGYEVGVPVKNPITSDVVSVIYPLRIAAVNILKDVKIPLWNPYMFAGYPLLANFQVAIFSPTFFLYFLFPKIWAWTAQVILQPFLAALFSYLFLRSLKLSKVSSVFGGIIYAFSGFNLIWLEWNTHVLVAAFIPLILLIVKKYLDTKKLYWLVLLSFAISFQIFSGYPQLLLYTLFAVILFLLFNWRRINFKKIIIILFFFGFGVLLTSLQTIPAFELLSFSQRSVEILSEDLVYLPWQNLISFFAPDYFGNHATMNFWGAGNYTNNVGYTGIVSFILALIGFMKFRKRKEVVFLFSIVALSLLISLPFPWTRFFTNLGFLGLAAASNTRALVLANLGIAYLAAFGLEALSKKTDRKDVYYSLWPFAFVITVFLTTYFFYQKSGDTNLLVALRNLILPGLLAFLATSLFLFRKKMRNKKIIVLTAVILALLAIGELFRFGWKYTPFSAPNLVFPDTPVITFLKNQKKPFRFLSGEVIPMNMWVPYQLESPAGYDAVYPKRWARFLAVANSGRADAKLMGRHGTVSSIKSPLLDLANGKYLMTLSENVNENSFRELGYEKAFQDKSVAVYKNKEAKERAYMVYDWEVIENEDKILSRLLDDGFYKTSKIILEENPREVIRNGDSEYSVQFIELNTTNYTLRVETGKTGFLFVSDVWYPGWKAYVDGKEERIYRANYTFRAVPISEGKHKVQFIYEPESFKIGGWLSIATLIFLLVVFLYDKKKISQRTS
jgi:uncharacterized membrane protein YfhO